MRKTLFLFFIVSLFVCPVFQMVNAQSPQQDWCVTNGSINAIVQDGNTVYIGGTFTQVGPNIANGVALDKATGAPDLAFANPDGNLYACIPDGSGGWYIGGSFTHVDGQPRANLARINGDGSVAPWNPNPGDAVYALAVSGSTVYVGGLFTIMGGQARGRLAALDATDGNLITWDPNANSNVYALVVSGSTLYVGGAFTKMGNYLGRSLAVFSTGATLPLQYTFFKARLSDNQALLNWETIAETNTSRFEIERSADGTSFSKIGAVTASGNSSATQYYSYTDADAGSLGATILYYRLKMMDLDDHFTYSSTALVRMKGNGIALRIYPNPAKDIVTWELSVQQGGQAALKVFDYAGQRRLSESLSLQKGSNTADVDVSGLAAGHYILVVKTSMGQEQVSFIKQ